LVYIIDYTTKPAQFKCFLFRPPTVRRSAAQRDGHAGEREYMLLFLLNPADFYDTIIT
jgi:hypothetical protein